MRADIVSLFLWDSRGHARSVTCALIQDLKTDRYTLLSFYTCFFQLQKEMCSHYLCMKDIFPIVKYQFVCVFVMFP